MNSLLTTTAVAEFEIEEHVAAHNAFMQKTALTLDDLDVYAEPLGNAVNAVRGLADSELTETQAIQIIRDAVTDLVVIDTKLAWENSTKAA